MSGIGQLIEPNCLAAARAGPAEAHPAHERAAIFAELDADLAGRALWALIDGVGLAGVGGGQLGRCRLGLVEAAPLGLPAGVAAGGTWPARGERVVAHTAAAVRYGTVTRRHVAPGPVPLGPAAVLWASSTCAGFLCGRR